MFESTIELYDRYYQKHCDKSGFSNHLGCEVRERLQQLDYLLKAVQEREQRERAVMQRHLDAFEAHVKYVVDSGLDWEKTVAPTETKPTKQEFDEASHLLFEMQLFTECFYYLAGRLRTILRNKVEPFPKLTSFECEGARNVRNWLLEHSEQEHSRVTIRSFAWGGSQGPVLKSIREQGQEHVFPDRGLYHNANGIKTNLEKMINEDLD
jgi:hypothetical protein